VQVSRGTFSINRVVVSVSSGGGTDYLDRRQQLQSWITANRKQGLVTVIYGLFFDVAQVLEQACDMDSVPWRLCGVLLYSCRGLQGRVKTLGRVKALPLTCTGVPTEHHTFCFWM
jgi:hypothetical protein